MKNEPRHNRSGASVSEWVSGHTERLRDNGSGFWDIVSCLHNFDLDGPARIDFVRRTILALIAKGGRPVVASEKELTWEETFKYGSKPEEIADAVIAEWMAEGGSEYVEWGRWWFAYPGSHR